jgi:hypothetical protein
MSCPEKRENFSLIQSEERSSVCTLEYIGVGRAKKGKKRKRE